MKLIVHEFVSLDGVMQSPGSPEEDAGGGFDRGGWQVPFTVDEDFGRIVGGWFDHADEFLLGRSTYEMIRGFWSHVTDPGDVVAAKLNGLPKHVVSSTLTDPGWKNVSVISAEPVGAVKALKDRPGRELQVHGSWQLARTLHDAGLVDEYRLLVCPVVIGIGKRLFDADSAPSGFTLVDSAVTSTGAIHQVLRPTALRIGAHVVEDGKDARKLTD
ncbi:dihydrofolate reductase [Pseudonocardia hierapolitana]|uniref:Dihydrofolate reductase n=1 Tax=Pseudonocardia hierapolitana TaxID=1128676 RepID=A0A561T012_9PSEU|nr:dihydrofolate reductase family protein [Pseudonocardia hierapolitana]TWF80441.1 dihydrofolate reductase [Pseudonocardia hierapolitana]